jgi:ABC-2 type transport system permease protein
MRVDKMLVIARREYVTRVRSKGFWIATVLLPLFILAMTVLPALVMSKAKSSHKVVVVDATGQVAGPLVRKLQDRKNSGEGEIAFDVETQAPAADADAQRAALDRQVLSGGIDAWLWITHDGLNDGKVEYHSENISNFATQSVLKDALTDVVRRNKLIAAGVNPDQIEQLDQSVGLNTLRVTEKGGREEGSTTGLAFAYILFFLLYIVLLIYGQQVMQGVLEEKTSRVVEVVVSSASPFELMLGKLVGVSATGFTQLAVWLGTVAVVTLPAVAASIAWLPAGFHMPVLPVSLVIHFFVLFLLGFFLFASFYAAIGASFNTAQEAQQLSTFAVVFLIVPFIFLMPVINDPDSTLSVVLSMIPVFTPLVMMLRLAVKTPPWWQIAVAYSLTAGFTLFMIWTAARIYRVGILMYGKKPTVQEILRWTRYA